MRGIGIATRTLENSASFPRFITECHWRNEWLFSTAHVGVAIRLKRSPSLPLIQAFDADIVKSVRIARPIQGRKLTPNGGQMLRQGLEYASTIKSSTETGVAQSAKGWQIVSTAQACKNRFVFNVPQSISDLRRFLDG